MRYKKKKGSTLVVVVCLCAFLSVLTLSIMLVTTGGFKLRKDENTRVENFYSADSGIEIAKNTIVEVIGKAIDAGEKVIADITKNPGGYPHIDVSVKGWEQEPFKQAFEDYIKSNLEKAIDNTALADGSAPVTTIYDGFKRDELVVKVDAVEGEVHQNGKPITGQKPDYSVDSKRHQEWEITSNFKDKDKNDREVKVNYNIKTPNYGKDGGRAVPNMNIFDYIMGIDGNLDVNNNGTFSAIGHMWIGGDNESGDRNMDLLTYKPGIKLHANAGTKGANFKWDGNVVTSKDIFVEDGNLQADNLYADDFLYKGDDHTLNFNKDILLRNDFIFDAEKSNVKARNYYGLDDIDEKQVQTDAEMAENIENWGTSSSIIVNSKDFGVGSKITITDDAYVLGTAYLDLEGEDYKTGESIAINKIAEPYTSRRLVEEGLGDEIRDVEYVYKYLNPLHILDRKIVKNDKFEGGAIIENLTVADKEKIVLNHLGEGKLDTIFGGLSIGGNTYSSGVLYDDGVVKKSNGSYPKCTVSEHKHGTSAKDVVECKRKEFAEEAYNMGGELSYGEAEYAFKKKEKQINVEQSFDWKYIRDNMMREKTLKKEDGTVIFDRTHSFPADESAPKDVAIFNSTMKVKDIIKGEPKVPVDPTDPYNLGALKDNYFLNSTVTIIFNSSERDSTGQPVNPKELNFKEGVTAIVDAGNNKINLPLSYINNPTNLTIVISDGNINIIQPFGGSWQVRGMFYSSENLNLGVGATMTFGNFSVPRFYDINDIFKKLFGGVIGGVVEGGVIDQGNGEYVVNPPDLLEQKDWNLIK